MRARLSLRAHPYSFACRCTTTVEELATIDAQLDKELTFEDRDDIPIEDAPDTTEPAAAT